MRPAPYAPRAGRALDPWAVGAMTLKVYHIGPRPPSDALLAAARSEAARVEAAAAAEGEAAGQGFAVLHEGQKGTWLLLDWWAHGDILCQRLSLDEGHGFAPVDDRPLTACVWELPFLSHERDAWVRHMMTERPDPTAWAADLRPDGPV